MLLSHTGLEVVSIAGRGRALRASRDIISETTLFIELPFARVYKRNDSSTVREHPEATALMRRVFELAASGTFDPRDFNGWPEEVVQCMEGILDVHAAVAFDKLSSRTQKQWMSLQDSRADLQGTPKTPGGVLRTNGFDDKFGYGNLYEVISRANHSCSPNAERLLRENHGVELRALRKIAAGEEVTVAYIDLDLPYQERQKHLLQQYGFNCVCEIHVTRIRLHAVARNPVASDMPWSNGRRGMGHAAPARLLLCALLMSLREKLAVSCKLAQPYGRQVHR
eukprot:6212268-Pleurochrysis_carterae.AAC.1